MAKTTTALFDLDGTLIDSTEAILESFAFAFDFFGAPKPDEKTIVRLIGSPLAKMFADLGVSEEQKQSYIDRYKERYGDVCLQKTFLLPNVEEALKTLKPIAKIGVVTTKSAVFSKKILTHLGVKSYIDEVIGFEDAKNPKPNAEPILFALNRLGSPRENAFMIGDTPIDINAAINAKITPIGVLCGYSSAEVLAPYNCAVYTDALEAAKAIAALSNSK
ncbi:MAG: HAD family hydrolase [Helicobacteraceae bacterium]|jgi:phosphoglycolate phosphatase|nr:HAD family hydrolase [Helicobacteraceae bacterium]